MDFGFGMFSFTAFIMLSLLAVAVMGLCLTIGVWYGSILAMFITERPGGDELFFMCTAYAAPLPLAFVLYMLNEPTLFFSWLALGFGLGIALWFNYVDEVRGRA
jgi:hypothetical protein